MVRLYIVFEDTLSSEVEFVSIAPDPEALLDISDATKWFEMGIGSQVPIIIAMGNDIVCVTQSCLFKIRGVETKKFSFANLLGITEKLVAILPGFIPGLFELGSGSLTFNDE